MLFAESLCLACFRDRLTALSYPHRLRLLLPSFLFCLHFKAEHCLQMRIFIRFFYLAVQCMLALLHFLFIVESHDLKSFFAWPQDFFLPR